MADGFLGRWSKRKAGIETKQDPSLEKKVEVPKEAPSTASVEKPAQETPPPVTLEDVEKMDRFDPDFSAFMKPDVDPAVQQAALKKMFTDPHFNIMDGLDIYIDDYSKPDPLPPGMLERMVQGDMLNLFRKSSEEPIQEVQKNANPTTIPQLEADTLADQQQSALTSSQQIPVPLDEKPSAASSEASIEPEQKKT